MLTKMNHIWTLKKRAGFTLVELIIVLVIIAILAAIAIPSMMKYVDNAKYSHGEAEIHEVRTAISAALAEAAAQDIISKLKIVSGNNTLKQEQPTALISRGKASTDVIFKQFSAFMLENISKRLEKADLKDFDISVSITIEYQLRGCVVARYLDENDKNINICYVTENYKSLFGASELVKNAPSVKIDYIMEGY